MSETVNAGDSNGRSILLLCGMSDTKFRHKVEPIQVSTAVEVIDLVRRKPYSGNKIREHRLPAWLRDNLVLADFCRAIIAFGVCIFRRPAAIISIYYYYNGLMAFWLGKLFRIPVVQVLLGTDFERVLGSRMGISILKEAHYVGVGGNTSQRRLAELGVPQDRIFYPTSSYSLPKEKIPDQSSSDYDLVFVGSLLPVKRVDRLLNAVAELKELGLEYKLLIIGDGPLRKDLEALAGTLDIAGQTVFQGNIDNSNVCDYLVKSKLFVMTSETEGLPMAMMEALGCGLPVVVPDVGDISGLVSDGKNGVLYNPDNNHELAGLLKKVLEDADYYKQLCSGVRETRAVIEKRYGLDVLTEKWTNILREV
ncbi:hypothetical protein BVX97_00950 [bacterium E08(2017)]|nr:hypothetical protein BVX97_00950 [bacterium E08(2017)]